MTERVDDQGEILVWVAAAAAEALLNSFIAITDRRADHFGIWIGGFMVIFLIAAFVERVKSIRGE